MRVTTASGQSLTLNKQIGEGGEARIFSVPSGLVAKVYKGPDDPSFATGGSEEARNRDGAGRKLREIWGKLAAFPSGLPSSIVSPIELIASGGQNVGYLMQSVASPHSRMRDWMDRTAFKSLSIDTVREAFIQLALTLPKLHDRGVVVGDFNDLNVLIPKTGPVLIDADSFQYGNFPCRTFQTRFVDPLICKQTGSSFTMTKPHTPDTDWYALLIMLYQVLRGIGPYDGIHKPKGTKPVPHGLRPLQRITVHRPDVIVPKFATPTDQIHPDLMHAFTQRIDKDERGPIQESLLHLIGERAGFVAPASVTRAKGKVVAEELNGFPGTILHAKLAESSLCVVSHLQGSYYRNGAKMVCYGLMFVSQKECLMKFVQVLLVLFVASLFCSEASAWPFRSRARFVETTRTVTRFSGTPSQVAYDKACKMAELGARGHLGGGMAGCAAEGTGRAATAEQALAVCCFTGKRRCAASAVVKGRHGLYYAVKLFW